MVYMNWAKSVNDMILFNFFGNLYYMKEEIDKVLSEEMTDEDRVKIVNMLYYQIQSHKEQFASAEMEAIDRDISANDKEKSQ